MVVVIGAGAAVVVAVAAVRAAAIAERATQPEGEGAFLCKKLRKNLC